MVDKDYKKILVIQPDHIGDVLLATPLMRALRQRFPAAKIDVVVGTWAEPIVHNNPDIDHIYTFNFRQFNRGGLPCLGKGTNFMKIRAANYELAIMTRSRNKLIRWFAWIAGIPNRIGFVAPQKDGLLTTKVRQENPQEHVVLRNLRIAQELGASTSDPKVVLKPSRQDIVKAEQIFKDLPRPYICLNPGAGTKAKKWPVERFGEVAEILSKKYGGTVFISGGPEEIDLAKKVAGAVSTKPVVLAGKTSLLELAALAAQFDLFISNDSGPMHIAAAMGCSVIDLHSGTDYPSMWRPWGDEHTVLTHAEECDQLPCFKTECDYFEHGCLERITVTDVRKAAAKYLE